MTSPYSVYSADISVIAQLILDKINAAPPGTFDIPPTFTQYGDPDRIPSVPGVCVEPGDTDRTLSGVPNMTTNEFTIYVLIYHLSAEKSISVVRKETDQLAYQITRYLHQDLQLTNGALTPALIHGFVRSSESGYAYKEKTLYRSARLTYFGMNKTSLAES